MRPLNEIVKEIEDWMPRDWANTDDEYMDMVFSMARVMRTQGIDACTACTQLGYCD